MYNITIETIDSIIEPIKEEWYKLLPYSKFTYEFDHGVLQLRIDFFHKGEHKCFNYTYTIQMINAIMLTDTINVAYYIYDIIRYNLKEEK